MTPRSRTFARRLRVRAGRRSGESSGTFKAWSSVDPSVVLTNGFDCRSRRAARGAERSRAMSSRKRRCLAFRLREAKKRWKPGRDGKVLESGWRVRV
jgi:hypothetical protein